MFVVLSLSLWRRDWCFRVCEIASTSTKSHLAVRGRRKSKMNIATSLFAIFPIFQLFEHESHKLVGCGLYDAITRLMQPIR
jgi:hypothetical protein